MEPSPGKPRHGSDAAAGIVDVGEYVDAHLHFWDPGRLPYPWLGEVPAIGGAHTPAELHAEAGPRLPSQIVFVQADCASPMEEVAWIESLAARERRIAAIVAFTPVDRGADTGTALQALRARPLVRGIRHLLQGESDPGFCLRPEFVAGVRRLGELGLTFDLCIRHGQLAAVIELCRRCPQTTFVLDHAGKPDIKGARLDPWRDDLARLAELSHVSCKLSGLVTEADHAAWTPADLQPYARHVLACFGPERVAFGSDWPVVKLASGYAPWLRTAAALLAELPAAARRAIFHDNARRIYRLADRQPPGQ